LATCQKHALSSANKGNLHQKISPELTWTTLFADSYLSKALCFVHAPGTHIPDLHPIFSYACAKQQPSTKLLNNNKTHLLEKQQTPMKKLRHIRKKLSLIRQVRLIPQD